MAASRKKRTRSAQRRIAAVIERLDPRLIVDAPLALASSGLVLAGPPDMEKQEPALFAAAAPAREGLTLPPMPPLPLDPKDDPVSPIGDPKRVGGGIESASTSCCGSCITYTVAVLALSNADEETPSTPGYLRFSVSASCSIPTASSVTVQYGLSGTATKNTDYTGALTSGTVTIPINAYSISGITDVPYNAVDDILVEPHETAIATIQPGSYVITAPSATGTIYDNEPTIVIGAYDGDGIEGDSAGIVFEIARTGSVRQAVTVRLKPPTGTAVEGTDYEAIPRSIEIPAGQYSVMLPVNLPGVLDEDDSIRTIELEIAPSENYYLGTPYIRADARMQKINVFQVRKPIWWFGGEDSGSYDESSGLQAGLNTGEWKWEVVAGRDKVNLNAGDGGDDGDVITEVNDGNVTVKSTGGSAAAEDVKINLSRNGKLVDEHKLTVRQPNSITVNSVADEAFENGYRTTYRMTIRDQFDAVLPEPVEVNEEFGAWAPDFPENNWPDPAEENTLLADPADFFDIYTASGANGNPEVVNPGQPGANEKVEHATQKYRVGSNQTGRGVVVKTHTLQVYRGKARQE